MISLKELYELQEIDSAIWEREQTLSRVNAELSDDKALNANRVRLEQLESQLDELGSARRNLEFTVSQIQEKIAHAEGRLYGGSVTNTRELSALQDEKSLLERQLSETEDRLLEHMVNIEDLQETRNKARQQLQTLETTVSARNAQLVKEKDRLEGELDRLRQERQGTVTQVAPSALPLYQSLLKSRNGVAVSKVDRARSMCQACRVTLPASDIQKARASETIVQCSNCRRILYVV